MIYHLAVVGFMIVVAYACFYYYWHFDEIERNDNPGILEIFALFQGGMSISNAMIFIAFTVMLYFDVRKQKKWDLMSGKLIK
ncbi:MAG: prolipoprotein diacylglyceryl transferase [Planctomycetaceae bacterium]|nr:prolipoprotein diacylglyceryl transferase [Planctomycetaceae bacterium]